MKRTIESLIEDIRAAHRTFVPKADYTDSEKSIEKHFEEIEKWLAGKEPEYTLGYWCGLEKEIFFPEVPLSEEEMKSVLLEFNEMLLTWNVSIDLPENLPTKFAYHLSIGSLDERTDIVNEGMVHFDFCTGYAPECELKEHCRCLEIWNSNDFPDDMDDCASDDDLPF